MPKTLEVECVRNREWSFEVRRCCPGLLSSRVKWDYTLDLWRSVPSDLQDCHAEVCVGVICLSVCLHTMSAFSTHTLPQITDFACLWRVCLIRKYCKPSGWFSTYRRVCVWHPHVSAVTWSLMKDFLNARKKFSATTQRGNGSWLLFSLNYVLSSVARWDLLLL